MNWHCKNVKDVTEAVTEQGVNLPLSDNIALLKKPLEIAGKRISNPLAIQPMEGCDGGLNGMPEELTWRRYGRFARSGAGVIWFEAVAITFDGRANSRQLLLNQANLEAFKRLVHYIREEAAKGGNSPLLIMQATHSGRYARPENAPAPIIAYNNPLFEGEIPLDKSTVISDQRLEELEELHGQSARLAQAAGFDGVDIKACHRYLTSELLSAYERPGNYGGCFENRIRFLLNSVAAAKSSSQGDFMVTSRLNIYDGFPYPYGFGVDQSGSIAPVLKEPIQLVKLLHQDYGVALLDLSLGNPYVNPHVNRPADHLLQPHSENPLVGLERMIHSIGQVKKAYPQMKIVGSGLSYLRQYAHYLAAGGIEQGFFDIAGFGRMAFAYPDFPQDIINHEKLDPKKVCITCSSCTRLMREKKQTGCVVRDSLYAQKN